MQELKIFNNDEFGEVRTIVMNGVPWFVGKDVAMALGYESPRSVISKKVEEDDRGVAEMETPSGKQDMTVINESGLYSLIFGSKLESAKKFKHWVTSEVLPTLRKTGTYTVNTSYQYPLPAATFDGVANLGRLIERVMRSEGSCPHEIAIVLKPIFQQAGIEIQECFIKLPAYEQYTLDIVTR